MSYSIAIAGKGGSGKTTLAGLIIRYLLNSGRAPVLAVDADGNANLHETLGLTLRQTVGEVLAIFNEDKISIPAGITKGAYLETHLNQIIVESRGVDLISMGRGEGAGCYCYPHSVLKDFVERLRNNYAYLVMDNEAGMEHLSRRTAENIDELIVVSDHSVKGVRTAARIRDLVKDLKLDARRVSFVISRAPGGRLDGPVTAELQAAGIEPAAVIPNDENLVRFDMQKRSILEIGEDSPAVAAVKAMLDSMLPEKRAGGTA
jgi:CO dehydrogenase maturation factor